MNCGSHDKAPRWVCVFKLQLVGVIVLSPLTIHSLPLVRVYKSFGGKVGRTFERMDNITLPPNELFTGDKPVILPKMGINYSTDTSICIKHSDPFPFNLLSITRIVEIGGGLRDVPGL